MPELLYEIKKRNGSLRVSLLKKGESSHKENTLRLEIPSENNVLILDTTDEEAILLINALSYALIRKNNKLDVSYDRG